MAMVAVGAAMAVGGSSPLPFDQPETAALRAAPRKVVAHYHCPFPTKISNKPEEGDYYTRGFLSPEGENGKHRMYGGYLRDRPYPIAPAPEGEDFAAFQAEQDVRQAIVIGLDGFIVNFVALPPSGQFRRAYAVLEAARRVDPGFRIVLSPDCVCYWKTPDPQRFVEFMKEVYNHPAVWRLDGKPVLAPWGAHVHRRGYWEKVLAALAAADMPVTFFPCPHGTGKGWLEEMAPLCAGLMNTAVGSSYEAARSALERNEIGRVHELGIPIYVQTVHPQNGRPKANCYWEAGNTRQFRTGWQVALENCGPQDWVQFFTWSDHGEFSHIRPATATQHVFADLAAYYTTWFKTGQAPEIVRDVLYYVHRTQSTTAQPDPEKQPRGPWKCVHKEPLNEIELLAFLKAPGTLQVDVGGQTYTKTAPAGVTSFLVPLREGTPSFKLIRHGRTEIHTRSRWTISNRIVWQDLLYHAGCSSREPNLARLDPEPANAVLDLRCNETWGPYVYDASGNHNDGLLDAGKIVHVTGHEANGLAFAADEPAAVTVPDHISLRPESFTICLWFRADAVGAGTLLAKANRETKTGYALFLRDGKLMALVGDDRAATEAGVPLTDGAGVWQFACCTFDHGKLRLYLNGERKATTTTRVQSLPATEIPVTIGEGFAGRLDEIRLYPAALDEAQIRTIYENSRRATPLAKQD
jgi:hypothetical protein